MSRSNLIIIPFILLFLFAQFVHAQTLAKKDSMKADSTKQIAKATPIPPQKLTEEEKKTTEEKKSSHLDFEGYVDFNYVKDFDNPVDNIRLYGSNPLHVNQFNLAYAFAQARYEDEHLKVTAAIHAGGIVDLMYAGEPQQIKPIRELSVYYKFKKAGFGIEAGIMPAVFGAETFINKDNQHATRAVMTDFAPDYEAGIRFHYKISEHWSGKVQMTNGWQVIMENNNSPAFGMVNVYETKKVMFNWGVFVGEEPYRNRTNQLRVYHNFFAKIKAGKFTLMPMLDIGMQRDTTATTQYNMWHSYGLSARYQLPRNFAVALRYERMYDPHNIIPELNAKTPDGFQFHGYTATIEYIPTPNVVVRLEGRFSNSLDAIFNLKSGDKSRYDNFIMLATHITIPRRD